MNKTELKANWKKVMELLFKQSPSKATKVKIDTWFSPLIPYKLDEENNILYFTSDEGEANFYHSMATRNQEMLSPVIKEVFGKDYTVSVISQENESNPELAPQTYIEPDDDFVNPHYNFDNFVSGANNRLALAVSLAVAESYAKEYNPLFIYGGSGLGKTHLLQAIANYIRQTQPNRNVLYVSSEVFTNEFITSIKNKQMEEFRAKYRGTDVLLIDDVQFLAGKAETEEELFHTFDALRNGNRQIVFSSDKPPKELGDMPERLVSRFAWGMIADIMPPDYETRVAILTKKAELDGFTVDKDLNEVICAIAQSIPSNIRELEGAFTRVVAHGALTNEKITKDLAKKVLTDVFSSTTNEITPGLIKKKVSNYFGIKISDMESSKRSKNITYPRQVAMFLIRNNTNLSLPQIGDEFGGRDHTTVLHSIDKINEEIKTSESLRTAVDTIQSQLQN